MKHDKNEDLPNNLYFIPQHTINKIFNFIIYKAKTKQNLS